MVNLLCAGTDTQRSVILSGLGPAYEHCREDTLVTLVPLMCKLVDGWGPELKSLTAYALIPAAGGEGFEVPADIASQVTDTAIRVVEAENRDCILQAWGDVLAEFLPRVRR